MPLGQEGMKFFFDQETRLFFSFPPVVSLLGMMADVVFPDSLGGQTLRDIEQEIEEKKEKEIGR